MNEYDTLLKQYPEYVSKEQLRLIAHVSKRTARYYLLTGLIPCVDNGKKTRNYQIKMTDIVAFLQDRVENPDLYRFANSDILRRLKNGKTVMIPTAELPIFRRYLQATLKEYQDAMTMREVEAYLGFEYSRIADWCASGLLQAIPYNFNYRIPKVYLIDFVARMESSSLWGRRTVGYKQRINDYAIWKLKKGNAGGREK
ncbi:MAG: hypothetical protein RR514_03575 [Christensenella sp.]